MQTQLKAQINTENKYKYNIKNTQTTQLNENNTIDIINNYNMAIIYSPKRNTFCYDYFDFSKINLSKNPINANLFHQNSFKKLNNFFKLLFFFLFQKLL